MVRPASRSRHRDGRIAAYGVDDDSRVRVANQRVTAWLVAREEDRSGNALLYSYLNEIDVADRRTRSLYLGRIDYTEHPDAAASRRVVFFYRQWESHKSGFVGGGELWHDRRLHRIKTQVVSPDGAIRDVRLYKLDYRQSDATKRALLERVRECLSEDDDSCNPPTRFDWQANEVVLGPAVQQFGDAGQPDVMLTADVTGDGLEDVVMVAPGSPFGMTTEVLVRVNAGNGSYLAATTWATASAQHIVGTPQVTDFDGDGRQDLLFATKTLSQWQVLLANDGSFLRGNSGIPFPQEEVNLLFRLADFDGDGMQDALLCNREPLCHGECRFTWQVWIGTPLRFKETAPPPQLATTPCWDDTKIVDVHGDGKVDILIPPASYFQDGFCLDWGDCNYQTLELDWTSSTVWVASDSGLPVKKAEKTLFVDVNGDGLPDAVQSDDGEPKTYLNTGAGFADPVPAVADPPATDNLSFDAFLAEAHPFEYDGDGNMDLLLLVDDCAGLVPCWSLLRASPSGDGSFEIDSSVQLGTISRLAVTDANGDGRHDVVTELSGKVTLRLGSAPNDLLVAVTDGMNASDPTEPGFVPNLAIRYGNLVDTLIQQGIAPGSLLEDEARYVSRWSYQSNPCEYPQRCVVGPLRVVAGYGINDGNNEERRFDVRYRNARFDSFGEGWLGFGARIVRDLATRHATAELYDNQTYDERFFVHPFIHRPFRTWTWTPALAGQPDSTQIALSYVDEELALEPTHGPTFFVKVLRRESQRLEGEFPSGGDTLLRYVSSRGGDSAELLAHTIHELLAVDDFGNVLDERSETVGVEQMRVERAFRNEEAKWLIGLPRRERTCSTVGDMTQCRFAEHEHDERRLPLRTSTTSSDGEPSQQLTLTRTFDAFGNAITTVVSDAFGNSRASCETFDAEGIFPIAHGNPLGHLDYSAWDAGHGVRLGTKDANGLLTRWTRDGFGRLIHTQHPNGRQVRQQYVRTKDGGPGGHWWTTRTRVTDDVAPTQVIEPDMLGRIVRRKVAAPSVPVCEAACVSGGWLVEEHTFNGLGRVARLTALHHEAIPSAAAVSALHLRRPRPHRRAADPVEQHGANPLRRQRDRVTDSAGTTMLVTDALGRPLRATDERGTVNSHVYRQFGQLREVLNAGESTRLSHDSLGRLRRLDDPNRGRTENTYTAFGELLHQRRPRPPNHLHPRRPQPPAVTQRARR